MRNKLITIISLVILSIILSCVATTKTFAATGWYNEAAEKVGNPILLEENQYFKGVSINSHIISDLTFMEIPFSKYLNNYEDAVQIITFSEAFYSVDNEIQEEIAMYVYLPGDSNIYLPDKIQVELTFISQKCLYDTELVEVSNDLEINKTYLSTWKKVSCYDTLVKYSFSSVINSKNKSTMKDWLVNKYSVGKNLTEVQTIFKTYIKQYNITDKTTAETHTITEKNSILDWYSSQEFQFVTQRSNPLAEAGIMMLTNSDPVYERTTACVATKEDTVSVVGQTVKYRYKMHADIDIGFFSYLKDTEWLDLYYLYFNVFDVEDNIKWGKEKYITEVNLKYIVAESKFTTRTNTLLWYVPHYYRDVTLIDNTGNKLETLTYDSPTKSDVDISATRDFLKQLNREELLISQTVTPEKIEFQYLDNTLNNAWVTLTSGWFDTQKTEYLTLFNTDSDEFRKLMDQSEEQDYSLIEQYQFGLVFGDKNGYAVSKTGGVYIGYDETIINEYMLAVQGLTDITYKENGEIFKVTVSENDIDNTGVLVPEKPTKDPWYSVEGEPVRKEDEGFWEWLQDLIDFFTIELPTWWEANGVIVIGVIIFIVVVIVVIIIAKKIREYKIMKAIQNPNTKEPPKKPKQKKKKE